MTAPPERPPARYAKRRWGFLLAGLALAVAGLVSARYWRPGTPDARGRADRAEAPDPRLGFPTPYRNVRPEVRYVGDAACVECHAGHADTYRHHPMGQAMAPVAEATPIERYGRDARNPFTAGGVRHGVRRQDGRVYHREWADAGGKVLAQAEVEVRFVVGSGARARSYLLDRGGALFQSSSTWFPQGGRWDLSPGYEAGHLHFSRPIAPGCLFCHCSQVDHVPDSVNRYREPVIRGFAIGCERCHGPGELHVERRKSSAPVRGLDDTIVNPARLEHSLREDVCHQCHVQAEQRVVCRGRGEFDYRPGLPLHLFVMDFVDARNSHGDFKFVSSVEQLRASRCYAESRGPRKLGCVSCHDPHRHPAPEEKVAHYRQRCLGCHTERSCALTPAARRRQDREDSCVGCHMPRLGSEVNHTAITDHRILRRPDRRAAAAERETPGPEDLVPFRRESSASEDRGVARNLGIAVLRMLDRNPPREFKAAYARHALPLLDAAVRRDGEDFPALLARGDALWTLGQQERALADYEAILASRPGAEAALARASDLLLELNRLPKARARLEQRIALAPAHWHSHHQMAVASFRLGDWERATRACEESLRLEPFHAPTRSLLIQCHLAAGRAGRASEEYETLRRLTPEGRREDLRRWYDEASRRLGAPPP